MPLPLRPHMPDLAAAEIPVERIHGPVLVIAGRDDGVWPSSAMAGKIEARLRERGFTYLHRSLVYDDAGHSISRPYTTTMLLDSLRHPLSGRLIHMGGTPSGTAHAREDSWRQMLSFVNQYLRDSAPLTDAFTCPVTDYENRYGGRRHATIFASFLWPEDAMAPGTAFAKARRELTRH